MQRTLAFIFGGGGFAVGLLSANFISLPTALAISSLVVLFCALLFWRVQYFRRLTVFAIFLIFGQLYFQLWEDAITVRVPYGESATLTASVVRCRESFRQFRCIAHTTHPFDARVSFEINEQLMPGTVVNLLGTVQPLADHQLFLKADGVVASLGAVKALDVSTPISIHAVLNHVKTASEAKLVQALTEPSASLATGLLFGSRQQFSDDFVDALKRTNTLHIVAVSGFNITILVEFIRRLLSSLPRKIVFALTSIAIVAFVLMIGAPASAVRAAIMGILLIFGNLIGRKPYAPSMIILTAILMALPNPYILRYDLGFQLSFLAFTGLIGLAPFLERKLTKITSPIRGLLAATLGASIATAPLLIHLNNTVSLIGPITNILILPLVPLIMLLGSLTLGVSLVSIDIARFVGLLLHLPSLWVTRVVEATASIPLASVHWVTGIGVVIALAFFWYLFRRRHAVAR